MYVAICGPPGGSTLTKSNLFFFGIDYSSIRGAFKNFGPETYILHIALQGRIQKSRFHKSIHGSGWPCSPCRVHMDPAYPF